MEGIQPAQLSFLAIYNPSQGKTDETVHDQVFYYYSAKASASRRDGGLSDEEATQRKKEERNEKLRQIGLAQGMVEFAKSFAKGDSIDSVESEKSRIVLHEFEPGWWILASVDLTRIQTAPPKGKSSSAEKPKIEFSSREICPPQLLLQQLLRAHSVFLLHHGQSLSEIFARLNRHKLVSALERHWNQFIRSWDVLMSGNPAVEIFNGIKLAAGGELGIGVGEEEWGSGEREVLEDFIERTEGLHDIVVSRFGDAEDPTRQVRKNDYDEAPWLGLGEAPAVADGLVFSGAGAVTRTSLRSLSAWMESIYMYGSSAYGAQDSPHSARRKRRQKPSSIPTTGQEERRDRSPTKKAPKSPLSASIKPPPAGIPPPIVQQADQSLENATAKAEETAKTNQEGEGDKKVAEQTDKKQPEHETADHPTNTETIMKYMTLGIYGSSWGIPSGRSSSQPPASRDESPHAETDKDKKPRELRSVEPEPYKPALDVTNGCFLIGMQGDLELSDLADEEVDVDEDPDGQSNHAWNKRILARTVHVEVTPRSIVYRKPKKSAEETSTGTAPMPTRLRVLVYLRRPFVFLFLFSSSHPALSITTLYRQLHHQLGPLQKPLLRSTDPSRARHRRLGGEDDDDDDGLGLSSSTSPRFPSSPRLRAAGSPSRGKSPAGRKSAHHHHSRSASEAVETTSDSLLDLTFDPTSLTVVSSIPNIPSSFLAEGLPPDIFSGPGGSTALLGGGGGGSSAGRRRKGSLLRAALGPPGRPVFAWPARADALAVHAHVVATWAATRVISDSKAQAGQASAGKGGSAEAAPSAGGGAAAAAAKADGGLVDLERRSRLTRGWWVEWVRVADGTGAGVKGQEAAAAAGDPAAMREVFLVRRAPPDAQGQGGGASKPGHGRSVSGSGLKKGLGFGGSGAGWGSGIADGSPGSAAGAAGGGSRIAEGLGIDARRYVELLLSLSR